MTRLLTADEVAAKSAANREAHKPRRVNLIDRPIAVSEPKPKLGRPKGKWKPPAPSEHAEQCAVILWADFNFPLMGIDPRCLLAVPNGGSRHPAVGAKMKAEGVRAGYPDLILDLARGQFHGLRIELKAVDGRIQENQAEYAKVLQMNGYSVLTCFGAAQAIDAITAYLQC